jgi:hypothetical protein
MMARTKVPITMKAIVQRINRKLKADDEALKKTRGTRAYLDLGDWYVLNVNRNWISAHHVDPEELGRELGVPQEWEVLVADGEEG